MKDAIFSLLETLTDADAVSADEGAVRSLIADLLVGHADQVETDVLGNVIASRGASPSPRLLYTSIDESGLVVTHIDGEGLLHFALVGDVSPVAAVGARARFSNGTLGIVTSNGGEGAPKATDLRLDIGASSADETKALVSVGDRAAFDWPLARRGDIAIGKAVGSRLGCAVLIRLLQTSGATDIAVVFAAQEGLGGRGLFAVASSDRTFKEAVGVWPVAGGKGSSKARVGAGPCLVVQDGAHVSDPGVRSRLEAAAAAIGAHRFVSRQGSSGPGHLQRSPGGVPLATIGIPMRNTDGVAQIASLEDAAKTVDILKAYLEA